ncbi:MAG: lipid-A-disaccharide synthase [Clostridium sp.]|nr:lipid-A-disaccharide synthase [Bacteroides sp.]MCM1199214.1 lipid-A-disaccharide synthase [Clostridium sp.]
MKYYIIAGEASGDLHGSNLMKGIYSQDAEAEIRFWGGDLMEGVYKSFQDNPSQASLGPSPCGQGGSTVLKTSIDTYADDDDAEAGIKESVETATGLKTAIDANADEMECGYSGLVKHYKEGAIMGFWEVLKNAGKLLGNVRRCKEDILQHRPDVMILIDYPGFNFKIAEFTHRHGIRTFYYIAPKVWASREGRIRKLKEYVDKLFIVFPFEIEYFRSKGVDFIYRGNPLVDAVDNSRAMLEGRNEFLERNSLSDKPIIAMLAGSRKGEISTMMPVLTEFARKMRAIPNYSGYQFIVAGAPARKMSDYSPFLHANEDYIKVLFGETQSIIRHAEAAVVNSGTASLETVLFGTPQVVGYISSPVTYAIAKHIVKVKYISLGNLCINRLAFKELIQDDCNADALVSEVRALIEDKSYRQHMLDEYAEIRSLLGGAGASEAVAKAMIELL